MNRFRKFWKEHEMHCLPSKILYGKSQTSPKGKPGIRSSKRQKMENEWEYESCLQDIYPDEAFNEDGELDEAYLEEMDYRRYCEADWRSTRL